MKKTDYSKSAGEAGIPISDFRIPHSEHSDVPSSALAWAGWSLPIPEAWQPLKVEGGWQKGSMMIGTEETPVALIKWLRPQEKRFDAERWMQQRFKDLGALPDDNTPTAAGFVPAQWVVALQNKEGVGKTIWYGYAPDADLLMECVSTSAVDAAQRDLFFNTLLPCLAATPVTEPVPWSLFSAAFTSPPGYTLTNQRIALGDVALELHNDNGHRLILRQVFPAALAMQRRGLEQWLDSPPFMERRHLRRPEQAHADTASLRQRGWKRLPAPMGWLKPRYCTRMAQISNDRLYLGETQSKTALEAGICTEAIAAMTTNTHVTA